MKTGAFGIDIGGTTVKIGYFDTAGTLLDKWEIPTRKEQNGEWILPDIRDAVCAYMKEHDIPVETVAGIGLDVPGAVLEGGIVNRCANLGWGVTPVKKIMETMLPGLPVRVANDANAAALGEMKHSDAYQNIVMVTLGTGVGGGVILNGEIWTGAFGAAGELGHIPVNPEETECCACGKKGCLEQYASATGIVRIAGKRLESSGEDSVLRKVPKLTAKSVMEAAKQGDSLAVSVVETACDILGRALASVACVVDPDAFVIGGGVSKAGPMLTDCIQKYYVKYAFHASRNTVFKLAELGNDAGICGAVQMILSEKELL